MAAPDGLELLTMLHALIPALAPILGKIVAAKFPDPVEAARAEAELVSELYRHQHEITAAAAQIVQTEAASQHWLAANWRPLLMLTFGGLIVARWFGLAAPDLSEAEYIKLWDIVQLGLGGYVIGRSAEKITPAIVGALRRP
jgi:hypothetical protein